MNDVYRIFSESFPNLPLTEHQFAEAVDLDGCDTLTIRDGDDIVGCALTQGENIRLICVLPDYRGRGIGSDLLDLCEKNIASHGHDRAVIGGHSSGLFIGALANGTCVDDCVSPFFPKRGYTGDDGCAEMGMALSDWKPHIPKYPLPDGLTFGMYKGSMDTLREAVGKVEEDWVGYFNDTESVYAVTDESGYPLSFALLDYDMSCALSGEGRKVGSVGCVGTIPEAREKGIGLAMVAGATEQLIAAGCTHCFIHYAYLEKWYGRLGFKTFLYELFLSKRL